MVGGDGREGEKRGPRTRLCDAATVYVRAYVARKLLRDSGDSSSISLLLR